MSAWRRRWWRWWRRWRRTKTLFCLFPLLSFSLGCWDVVLFRDIVDLANCDGGTEGRSAGGTEGQTDTSYRDAEAHLKRDRDENSYLIKQRPRNRNESPLLITNNMTTVKQAWSGKTLLKKGYQLPVGMSLGVLHRKTTKNNHFWKRGGKDRWIFPGGKKAIVITWYRLFISTHLARGLRFTVYQR